MKIGIITVHNSPNYGASLQSYALWAYIERQGHSCEVIDLHRPYQDDYIPSRRYRPYGVERTYKSIVKSFVRRFVRRPKGNALYSEERVCHNSKSTLKK
ncbi:MAG: polysaccharide pyruvyl transferase family protein [Paraprevotella sp.]|nr:polysaccharide pyruvyl transferase family protein [Paraprevotella sp.]